MLAHFAMTAAMGFLRRIGLFCGGPGAEERRSTSRWGVSEPPLQKEEMSIASLLMNTETN